MRFAVLYDYLLFNARRGNASFRHVGGIWPLKYRRVLKRQSIIEFVFFRICIGFLPPFLFQYM